MTKEEKVNRCLKMYEDLNREEKAMFIGKVKLIMNIRTYHNISDTVKKEVIDILTGD